MNDASHIRTIAVIGLGYVGLPLAVAFGKTWQTIGFDKSEPRIQELKRGHDRTNELGVGEIKEANRLTVTSDPSDLSRADFYIVTVPTPIDESKRPDLSPLKAATHTIASCLKPGDVVVYESTVYPGVTNEVCVPILEEISGLRLNKDFSVGYSPERINPGDSEHRFKNIVKVVSGSSDEALDLIDEVYSSVVEAGTFRASSIKVAEAAKVIENTQRDLNIALINELSMIFELMGINTTEVLEAASTKWNFLRFTPGLVGGHCIGVDPYYLTYKAETLGYLPQVILAGRRINDNMGRYVGQRVVKLMSRKGINVSESRALILGLSFKENCPDIRNSLTPDIARELAEFGVNVDLFDPYASAQEAELLYNLQLIDSPTANEYDAVVMAVPHKYFVDGGIKQIRTFLKKCSIIFDVKGVLDRSEVDGSL